MQRSGHPDPLDGQLADGLLRVEQAKAHLKAAMRIFAVSADDWQTNRDDFLIVHSRVEELEEVAAAMRAASDPPSADMREKEQRVKLLAALRDLATLWDDSAGVLRGRFGAFMEDVDDELRSALEDLEKRPNKRAATTRALRKARRLLGERP